MAYIIGSALAILAILFGTKAVNTMKKNLNSIPENIARWGTQVSEASEKYGVPKDILYSIIWQESSGVKDVTHNSSAIGLMGIKPIAYRDVIQNLPGADRADFPNWKINPDSHIKLGSAFLRLLYSRYGNWETAIKAYKEGGTGMKNNPGRANTYLNEVENKRRFFG